MNISITIVTICVISNVSCLLGTGLYEVSEVPFITVDIVVEGALYSFIDLPITVIMNSVAEFCRTRMMLALLYVTVSLGHRVAVSIIIRVDCCRHGRAIVRSVGIGFSRTHRRGVAAPPGADSLRMIVTVALWGDLSVAKLQRDIARAAARALAGRGRNEAHSRQQRICHNHARGRARAVVRNGNGVGEQRFTVTGSGRSNLVTARSTIALPPPLG